MEVQPLSSRIRGIWLRSPSLPVKGIRQDDDSYSCQGPGVRSRHRITLTGEGSDAAWWVGHLDRRPICGCGRVFQTEEALQQHKRDSPSHAQEGTTGDTESLWRKPVTFVGAGNKTGGKGREKKKSKTSMASGSYRVWSASGECYSDVGYDHSLCDKDCGWCGHCAESVWF